MGGGERACVDCPAGQLQWKEGQSACIKCPAAGVDCSNATAVVVLPGYYRPSDWWVPSRCPIQRACGGGGVPGLPSCEPGSEGPLCGSCSEGYRRSGHECEVCGSDSMVAMGFGSVSVGVLGIFLLIGVYLHSYLPPLVDTSTSAASAKGSGSEVASTAGDEDANAAADGSHSSAAAQSRTTLAGSKLAGCCAGLAARVQRLVDWIPASAPRQAMTTLKILVGYLQTVCFHGSSRSARTTPHCATIRAHVLLTVACTRVHSFHCGVRASRCVRV